MQPGLAESGAAPGLGRPTSAAEIARGAAQGPYGSYPAGPLSAEDMAGPVYRVPAAARQALGPRLAAALEHAHLLVFHPRDANPPAAPGAARCRAGRPPASSPLSQLVAFPVVPDPGRRGAAQPRNLAGRRLIPALRPYRFLKGRTSPP